MVVNIAKPKEKPEPHSFNEKIAVAVGFVEVFLKQISRILLLTY
jgi:hypothetical protein